LPDVVCLAQKTYVIEFQFGRLPVSPEIVPPVPPSAFSDLKPPACSAQGGPGGIHAHMTGILPLEEMGYGSLGLADSFLVPEDLTKSYNTLYVIRSVLPVMFEIQAAAIGILVQEIQIFFQFSVGSCKDSSHI
jgi:hypothetical protein